VRLTVRRVGPGSARVVLDLIHDAFGSRPAMDPPAPALSDTEASISTRLALHGGLVANLDGEPVGCVLLEPLGDTMYLRRFGTSTAARGQGVAQALVRAAEEAASAYARLTVVAREELPATVDFWRRRGFVQTDRRSPYVELSRSLPNVHHVPTPEAMRDLGARVAGDLRRGDLLVLTGDLGAGKTTFTQGLGRGLQVEGRVTSPTFVIAREHASSGPGPELVHVDAYRLGDAAELDDLDLDTSLASAVTVVEWGEGKAEPLSDSRLEVRIRRDVEGVPGAEGGDLDDAEPRVVEIVGRGPRWANVWRVSPP